MTILVTGATGNIGAKVVHQLLGRGASVRALIRDPAKARFPAAVELAKGEMLDVDAVRKALDGVSTVFLLNAVVPDEFTQALVVLNLARQAGIQRYVYLSVIHSDVYADVPHFAGKHAVERMIGQRGLHATVLRPAYFMDNDRGISDAVLKHGVYPMPIGNKGLAMVDTADLAEVAAIELLRRERSETPLPARTMDVVGPDALTGPDIATIWSEVLGRPIAYGGDDTAAFENTLKAFSPSWMAYDMRLMADRFQSDGMQAEPGDVQRLVTLLGRPLRSYRDFATAVARDA